MVEWLDSHMSGPGWQYVEEIDEEETGLLVRSVGFVLYLTDDAITLAPNYVEDPAQVSQLMVIPKSAVQSITQFNLKKED